VDDLPLELGEADPAPVADRLTLEEIGNLVAPAGLDVAVDAVVADVELAAEVPLRVGWLPSVELLERLEPADALAPLVLPELIESALVDVRLGVCVPGETVGRRITPLLQEAGLDRGPADLFS
jgi:hypothetical protein